MSGIEYMKNWIAKGNLILIAGILLAFIMPFGKIFVPPFIVLFVVSVIASPGFGRVSLKGISPKYLLLPVFFYLYHVIGMIWTKNYEYGLSDLEIKASLIIFPLIILFSPRHYFGSRFLKSISLATIAGCFISLIISNVSAWNLYADTGDICSFYYSNASIFMHTSYISLYIVFTLYILYSFSFKPNLLFWFFYVISLLLVFYLNLLSSKAGFFTFVLAMLFIAAELIIKRKWKNIILYFLIPSAVFASSIFYFPVSTSRIQTAVQTVQNKSSKEELNATGESTADRLLIWDAALSLSKKNLLTGSGTGDVKDELINSYNEKGLTYPVQLKLNAHNQFINTLVALGLPALILLIVILLIPFWVSLKNKYWLYAAFIAFFTLNIMVESMLEVQAGIVFFAFWNSVLWICLQQKILIKTPDFPG
jgi:O-antigen ligase